MTAGMFGIVENPPAGSVVDRALSFMGGIYSKRPVDEEVAPAFIDLVQKERADVVFVGSRLSSLSPVRGADARIIEAAGISMTSA